MRLLPILLFACSDNSVKTTNSSPDIIISSHNNNSSFNDGDIVTFRAEVSDLDESSSNLRTSWYINNTLACDWANANESGTAECPIPMTLGATQINVTVKDSQDAASMTTLNIQVWPAGTLDTGTDTNSPEDTGTTNTTPDNLPPVVFITSPESGETFVENDDIDFKGLTFDYQEVANDLSIEWSSTSIGVFDITNSDSEGNISTQSPLPAGTHQISLTVTDSGGLSSTKTTDIEILSLVLPTVQCQILSPNNGDSVIIGNSGNQFIMEGFVGSSGPISELSYNFSSDVDGWLDSGNINSDGSLGWSGTSLTEASHNFTIDVSYMGQSVCSDTIQVTIEQPVLTITHKNIFVTSQRHDGNFGGITGADTFCQGLATSAGLSGTYLAWLSDTTTSPSARFAQANVPYRLVDGTTIANDWADLVDGSIQNPINLDEYGNAAPSSMVFTFTMTDGTAGVFQSTTTNCYGDDCHCNNWTNSNGQGSPTPGSAVGQTTQTNDDWTDYSYYNGCGPTGQPIYCFEQ
jgi:hypothetical protein